MGLALDPSHWGLLILTGAFTGLGFGLFGRAGELAIAPALLAILPVCGVPAAAVPKLAAATAIAILIPVTVAHSEGAIRRQAIDWDLFLLLAPGTAVGAVLITTFADSLSGGLLNLLIVMGIAILALRLFWKQERPAREIPETDNPPLIAMTLKAVAISAGAAAIGVSGGLVIASMLERNLDRERATATANALTLPFALAASLGYFLSPAPEGCGPACGGAIFLPALAATGMAAVLTAPLAAWARQFLPQPAARRLFAVFIIAGAYLFALPAQTIPDLLASSRDSVLEALLAPLCDPEPAPAAPAFEDAKEKQGPAAPATFKDEPAPAMTKKWVTAWTASVQGPYPYGFALLQPDLSLVFPAPKRGASDQSFRMIVRPDLWGSEARIRLSNVFGTKPVRFDGVYTGLRFESSALVPGTNRPVTFGGKDWVVIPPGQEAWSDAIRLPFVPVDGSSSFLGRKLAVSFHAAGLSRARRSMLTALNSTSSVTAAGSVRLRVMV
jgi:uncharacterized membrane protein YfcA